MAVTLDSYAVVAHKLQYRVDVGCLLRLITAEAPGVGQGFYGDVVCSTAEGVEALSKLDVVDEVVVECVALVAVDAREERCLVEDRHRGLHLAVDSHDARGDVGLGVRCVALHHDKCAERLALHGDILSFV